MISFQNATESDADLISAMAREIWSDVYADMITPGQIEFMLEWMYSPETLRREMADEGVSYHFITEGNSPIGYLAFSCEADTAHLHKLYLKPHYHGRGIGSAALAWLTDHCRSKGTRAIKLRVNRSNHRAIRAYEKNGFFRTGSIVQDIGDGYLMDDHIYQKPLP